MTAKLTTALILAGGLSRRMGEDKTRLDLSGNPLIRHVISRISPQVSRIMVSAPAPHPAAPELTCLADTRAGNLGPLAGILSGLRRLEEESDISTHLLICPADTPFLPHDLVKRLLEKASAGTIVISTSNGRSHPLVALWPRSLVDDLDRWLDEPANRRVLDYVDHHPHAAVPFDDVRIGSEHVDPFFNINHRQDLARAHQYLSRSGAAVND